MCVIALDKPTTADMTTLIDVFFGQVSRAVKKGASGPEAFTVRLRPFTMHVDPVDTEEGYTRLYNFGLRTGTGFCCLS